MSGETPDERPQRRREYSGAGSTLGLALLIVVTVGVAIWYFELRGEGTPASSLNGDYGIISLPDDANSTGQSPAAREGRAAPGFRLADVEGEAVELVDFRGSYVLLNFWATWCPPCRAEIPDLAAFHAEAANSGWLVVGINQQERRAQVSGFLEPFDVSYPQLLDEDGEVSNGYRVGLGLPITFILDPAGVILRVHVGPLDLEQMRALQAELSG